MYYIRSIDSSIFTTTHHDSDLIDLHLKTLFNSVSALKI